MSFFTENQTPNPELAACYKIFIDLLTRMREAEIQLNIYDSYWIDDKSGPCKTTKLTLSSFETGGELPVVAAVRPFPIFRSEEELLVDSNDHLGSQLICAALAAAYCSEYKGKNILDFTMRELLDLNYHIIRHIDEMSAKNQEEAAE
ncbi:MAG TPA: hypothetical protein DEB39_13290 [Planctomycetaceae bacterium]|nr:hypothetical protein [Planctomycetaceae bacterium]